MKALVGDKIKFNVYGYSKEIVTERVVSVEPGEYTGEMYETISGWFVSEHELGMNDVIPKEGY